jgi:hypothetical protein
VFVQNGIFGCGDGALAVVRKAMNWYAARNDDYPYKRSHLVALRTTKISASNPPSTWWPGER